ncbi:hypothetical protein [Microvirga sp. P5_D2]
MTPIAEEITLHARAATALLSRFHDSVMGKFLQTDDQAQFKQIVLEAKALLDEAFGSPNDFSANLVSTVNSGTGGYYGGPTYACVRETVAVLQASVRFLNRKPPQQSVEFSQAALKAPYVDPIRLAEIQAITGKAWDLTRLAQLCGELNIAHENDCFMSIAMLVRAIVDHVPPIFGFSSFPAVASNYAGTKSFKRSMEHLNLSLRNIADAHLHTHIRSRESLPTGTQVNFSQDLDVLLAEVVRVLRDGP